MVNPAILPKKKRGAMPRLQTDPEYRSRLIALYPSLTLKELTKVLGRSERQIKRDVVAIRAEATNNFAPTGQDGGVSTSPETSPQSNTPSVAQDAASASKSESSS